MRKEVEKLQNQNIKGEAFIMADKIAKENPYAVRDKIAFISKSHGMTFQFLGCKMYKKY